MITPTFDPYQPATCLASALGVTLYRQLGRCWLADNFTFKAVEVPEWTEAASILNAWIIRLNSLEREHEALCAAAEAARDYMNGAQGSQTAVMKALAALDDLRK